MLRIYPARRYLRRRPVGRYALWAIVAAALGLCGCSDRSGSSQGRSLSTAIKHDAGDKEPQPVRQLQRSTNPEAAPAARKLRKDPRGLRLVAQSGGRLGGPGREVANAVAQSADGTVALAGQFHGKLTVAGTSYVSQDWDAFIAAYAPASGGKPTDAPRLLWFQAIGGPGVQRIQSLTFDAHGGVAAVGHFRDGADFTGRAVTARGSRDGFIVKLSAQGQLQWHKVVGGRGNDRLTDVAITPTGDIAITGTFARTLTVGGTTVRSVGQRDIVVGLLSATGRPKWLNSYGSRDLEGGRALVAAANGDIIMAATMAQSIDFGGGPLAYGGASDIALVRLDPQGSHIWSASHGGLLDEYPEDIAIDPGGNVVMTASFVHRGYIGTEFISRGETDAIIARFSGQGDLLWARAFGSEAADSLSGLAVDTSGNPVVIGNFAGRTLIGGRSLDPRNGNFVLSYWDRVGQLVVVRQLPSATHDFAGLSTIVDDHVVISGLSQGILRFDDVKLPGHSGRSSETRNLPASADAIFLRFATR